MKRFSWALLLWVLAPCAARTPCSRGELVDAARQVRGIQEELKHVQVGEMDTEVPATARNQLVELKDALSCLADVALAQAGPSLDTTELQNRIAEVLTVKPSEPAKTPVASSNDEAFGSYGDNLTVSVSRPANMRELLEMEFSAGIPCGDDHMLLIYALDNSTWRRQLRWQAPPLKEISDAFGDFFVSDVLSPSAGGTSAPSIVVAHGTPWCTSRFSSFAIDVLSAGSTSDSPKVLWHTKRGYSRGEFIPTLRSSGDTFELRVNASSFDIDSFERSVVYRYQLDEHQGLHRIEPIAIHARGFVEEWLSAPWPESEGFSAQGASSALQIIHDQFAQPRKSDSEFVTHSHGPIRACKTPGTFQVEIRSTREKIVPGKPGGESQPLPTRYFHVREVKDGYQMVSARSEANPSCEGADLMPKKAN
ncbi:MAG TPA: hypothetical protein VMT32_02415 [Bryobacteraceae bacterium]|nr:hypothetical protein [Bryobacteraceae bacterium]